MQSTASASTVDWATKGLWLPDEVAGVEDLVGASLFAGPFTWPVMVASRSAIDANVATMAAYCARHDVDFAPHGKTSMAPTLFAAQLDAGAWGITVATANQALAARRFGVPRVVLANELLDPRVVRWAAGEADSGWELLFYVDSLAGVEVLRAGLSGLSAGVDGRSASSRGGHGGAEMVATMRAFAALQSWRSLTHSWTMLGSHDTERLHSMVDQSLVEVAVGLLMTLPGVPMIFAGDEVGLLGVNGEDARRPMPWPLPDHPSLPVYRSLIALRRQHEALRRGSLRWVYVEDNAVAFLRSTVDSKLDSTVDETLLVLARRRPGEPIQLDLPLSSAESLYDGPTLQIFRLHPLDA